VEVDVAADAIATELPGLLVLRLIEAAHGAMIHEEGARPVGATSMIERSVPERAS
jgi:hypothetical protein